MKRLLRSLLLLVGSLLLIGVALPLRAADAGSETRNFSELSVASVRFHALGVLQGDYQSGVAFDVEMARKYGFSEDAIRLSHQIASVTNDLIDQAKEAQKSGKETNITELTVNLAHYPDLAWFWSEAAQRSKSGLSDDHFAKGVEPLGTPGVSHLVCGYYPNPKPSSSAPWTPHTSPDPAATLQSWGYHETWPPDYTGGGWTRPQTYQPAFCGWHTYRDHAFITGPTTFNEQNYTGSPGGEPNPEVYRSGPWPYPDWPAYVYWWHVYGPGS